MESLLMKEEDQLGLNIVCEERKTCSKPKKKNNKYNKYEKRKNHGPKCKGTCRET